MTPNTYRDLEQIAAAVPQTANIITIDGFKGNGKTTLGNKLGEIIKAKHIDTDDYCTGTTASYIDQLDIEALKNEIIETKCIISGVLVIDVLKKIQLTSDYSIYVKRTYLNFSNELIINPQIGSDLDAQIIGYHERFKPHLTCDAVFTWDAFVEID